MKKGRLDKAAGESNFPFNFWFTFLLLGPACVCHTKESFKPGTTFMHFINSSVQKTNEERIEKFTCILKIKLINKIVASDSL